MTDWKWYAALLLFVVAMISLYGAVAWHAIER